MTAPAARLGQGRGVGSMRGLGAVVLVAIGVAGVVPPVLAGTPPTEEAEATQTADWPVMIARLRQEVQRRPGFAQLRQQLAVAYNNYGVSLSNQGQWETAVAQLREAVGLDPQNAQLSKNLAMVYVSRAQSESQAKRTGEALASIDLALKADPDIAEAYILQGDIEYDRQRLKEAREAWQHALKLEVTDVCFDFLNVVLEVLKRRFVAVGHLEKLF